MNPYIVIQPGQKVTIADIQGSGAIQLQDDIASVAYWYQTLPHKKFPELPDRDYLEII